MLRRFVVCAAAVLFGMAMITPAGADDVFIAGLRPNERPAGAPVMRVTDRNRSAAYQFRGIAKPYPSSLRFANNHGGWFTPFTVSGMTGRYDLRAYHQSPAETRRNGKDGG